jgi:HPt (histidine-containing phosphotransfer) domain-containing protein
LARIQTAIIHGDGRALERAAHSLKGTVMSFGAQTAGAAALRLEVMGRGGDLTQAAMACAELEREVAQLGQALAVFRGGPVA